MAYLRSINPIGFGRLRRLGGLLVSWPPSPRRSPPEAQVGTVPRRIGLLDSGSLASRAPLWEAFRPGMRELGYLEGRTVTFEARGADGNLDRLTVLAAELVRLKVDVMVVGASSAARAARQATAAIPIVMASGNPLEGGEVASLARPGGTVTKGLASGTRNPAYRGAAWAPSRGRRAVYQAAAIFAQPSALG